MIGRVLALGVALLAAPMLARACPTGTDALHAGISQNLTDDAALMALRGFPTDPLRLTPDAVAALLAEAFALTPQREHLVIYTQTDAGLCALVFDGTAVTATAARLGQTAATLTEARLDLIAALAVNARQMERAGHLRGAAPLAGDPTPVDSGTAAARLADLLMLADLAPALALAEEILILPANDIGTMPWALLPLGGGLVIDRAPVTIAPSAVALVRNPGHLNAAFAGQSTTGPVGFTPVWSGAVVVGDPDASTDPEWSFPPLPGARIEAAAVATQFAATPILGEKATPGAVLEALSQPVDLVYFAAHGVSSEADPLTDSFLALTGGRLTAGEVQRLQFPARPLVVLSACQTGLGLNHAGGTIGLARAFVLAGASGVVSTLWNVDDAATEAMMRDFAANLHQMRPTDALRHAMLTARDRHRDDPALWAGVMLLGGPSLLAQ